MEIFVRRIGTGINCTISELSEKKPNKIYLPVNTNLVLYFYPTNSNRFPVLRRNYAFTLFGNVHAVLQLFCVPCYHGDALGVHVGTYLNGMLICLVLMACLAGP